MNPLNFAPAPLLGLALCLTFPTSFPPIVPWICLAGLAGSLVLISLNNQE